MNFDWIHAAVATVGAALGVIGGVFAHGWRLGKIEERMKFHLVEGERRLEEKMADVQQAFDETLRGIRQKINDVELDAERRFLLKDDFNDFREEYRDDMRDLKQLISHGRKQ